MAPSGKGVGPRGTWLGLWAGVDTPSLLGCCSPRPSWGSYEAVGAARGLRPGDNGTTNLVLDWLPAGSLVYSLFLTTPVTLELDRRWLHWSAA